MAGRKVTVRRTATVYNGRNTDYDPRFTLEAGDSFQYLETRDGWLRVHFKGRTGWVDGTTCGLSDPAVTPAPTYTLTPSRWAIGLGGTTLTLRFEGTLIYLELAGNLPDDLLANTGTDGQSIVLTGTGLAPGPAWLDVNGRHCLRLELAPDGARLLLDRGTSWQINRHTRKLLRIEVAALAVAVAAEARQDREVLHVGIDGYVLPSTAAMAGGLFVELPGVNATADFPTTFKAARGTMQVMADNGDLLLRVQTRSTYPYVLRQDGNDVMVELQDRGLQGKCIVLDPGHDGSFDTGAVGANGTREADVNYDIAGRLADLLRQDGAKVILTHERGQTCAPRDELDADPYDGIEHELQARCDVANDADADLFLSIHNNANNDPTVSGTQTYYATANFNAERSAALAALAQTELVAALDSRDWGVLTEQFYVVKFTRCPAVLAEVLFLSNADDEAALNDPDVLQAAAAALQQAIRRYCGANVN